jgi:hypothetical protein
VLTAVLGGVTALLIPSYYRHMPEIAVASGVAIPFSLSQGLRSRHFLTGTVSLLPMLSALRIGAFALACFAISRLTDSHHLGPLGIAWGAFIAATLECTVYSAFNARAVSKPRLFWATFSICVLAAITNVGLAWAFIKLG